MVSTCPQPIWFQKSWQFVLVLWLTLGQTIHVWNVFAYRRILMLLPRVVVGRSLDKIRSSPRCNSASQSVGIKLRSLDYQHEQTQYRPWSQFWTQFLGEMYIQALLRVEWQSLLNLQWRCAKMRFSCCGADCTIGEYSLLIASTDLIVDWISQWTVYTMYYAQK